MLVERQKVAKVRGKNKERKIDGYVGRERERQGGREQEGQREKERNRERDRERKKE